MGVIPVAHAWCYDRQTKKVCDNTWPDGTAYLGVPFRTSYLVEWDTNNKHYLSILDDWRNGWPILKIADTSIWKGSLC